MAGQGTGRPITFRCWACKRSPKILKGTNYEATGRTRRLPFGAAGSQHARNTNRLIEYRCLTCGHRGWSKHRDMERALHLRQGQFKDLAPADTAW